jgi:hypothetical protein
MENIFLTQYINEAFDTKSLAAHRKSLISKYGKKGTTSVKDVIITPEKLQMLKTIRNDMGLFNEGEPAPAWNSFTAALLNNIKTNPVFVKKMLSNEQTAKKFIASFILKFRREIESTSSYLSEKLKTG